MISVLPSVGRDGTCCMIGQWLGDDPAEKSGGSMGIHMLEERRKDDGKLAYRHIFFQTPGGNGEEKSVKD